MLTRTVCVLTLLCLGSGLARPPGVRAQAEPLLRIGALDACERPIDGFGTTAPPKLSGERWLSELYFGDLGASVLRVDLTPRFRSPVSDVAYNSPWFHGDPPLPGPDGNNVRAYSDGPGYVSSWAGRRASIKVLGPRLEQNLTAFDYETPAIAGVGALARAGSKRAPRSEPLKLVGSIWSPAPWLKQSSGGHFEGAGDVMPQTGTPYPFIWAGNFAGGQLDTSDLPRTDLIDDTGKMTSALTQFTRITAAYVLGFQRAFGVRFYALSLQNELNFETFYNSCSYPRALGYVVALKALRQAFAAHAELREIKLVGPEDLIDASPYTLWQYGEGASAVSKNLQYMAAVANDQEASAALSFFAVHAYARDGVHGSGDDTQMWQWWVNGWSKPPAPGIPSPVAGTRALHKKSWMTESSGEASVWSPAPGSALHDSALGLAVKLHHALTVGEQSAWLYWQLLDGKRVHAETLTDQSLRASAPKYVAYKHFVRFIRPGACPVQTQLDERSELYVSAYRDRLHGSTVVLINTATRARRLDVRELVAGEGTIEAHSSDARALWQKQTLRARGGALSVSLPAQSVTTLHTQRERAQAVRK